MARAAGCYSEKGVVATAKTIMAFMKDKDIEYLHAAGQVMIIRDEIWIPQEVYAFREAFVELYGDINRYQKA